MPAGTETWTAPRDFRLRLMCLENVGWNEIGDALAVAPEVAMARANRIGARAPSSNQIRYDDPAREPLPVGHPRAWGVLTQGTWLAGTRYPMQVHEEPAAWRR